jgi:hypothetical protein
MKYSVITFIVLSALPSLCRSQEVPDHFKRVDQTIWVVTDIDSVMVSWKSLGFSQIRLIGDVNASSKSSQNFTIKMAVANLGGARISWIEPVSGNSVFSQFLISKGNGAMSLVHKLNTSEQLQNELNRLSGIGVKVLDHISITTESGNLNYIFMDTQDSGKYVLGYINNDTSTDIYKGLSADNRHHLKLNQYAFAINKADDISAYWSKIGFPEFQINHPELYNTKYQGKLVDHKLIQGWQRHGEIAYEWCIPVIGPIVYEDHIKLHGEGIHHLAFSVVDMDAVLTDYESLGYINTMGGTWGEKGKSGSGRYEYIGLENAGGMTIELLWSIH